jgi:hypothetical protein
MKNIAILLAVVLGLFCGVVPAALAQSADTHGAGTVLVAAPANAEGESVPRLVQFSGTLKDAAARLKAAALTPSRWTPRWAL